MPKKKRDSKLHDKYYHLAKEQGYRSRASFKLVQLNRKYDFLSKSRALLDLCAAPGGWLQVAAKYMPVSSVIIGVDLLPIKPIRGVVTSIEDITTEKCRQFIKKQLQNWKVDVVIHDGAPNVGGATWAKDAYGQVELVLKSLELSTQFLRPGGIFLTKVFRSQDYNALLWVLKQFFESIDVTKPAASRNSSAEIYVYCKGYLAPKKIDQRLLNPEYVFQEVEVEKATVNIFDKKPPKRNRVGYDTDGMMLYKEAKVRKFIESGEPNTILGAYNKLVFNKKDDDDIIKLAETNDEIHALCSDLRTLGKVDFRHLLKWRLKVRQALYPQEEHVPNATPKAPPIDADVKLQQRMEEEEEKALHDARVSKKKRKEKQRRELKRLAVKSANMPQVEQPDEMNLFSVKYVQNDNDVMQKLVEHGRGNKDIVIDDDEEDTDEDHVIIDKDTDDDDDDDEGDDVLERMSKDIDASYEEYKKRRNIRTKKEKRRLKQVGLGLEHEEDQKYEEMARKIARTSENKQQRDSDDDDDSEDEPIRMNGNDHFFKRDLFEGIELEIEDESTTATTTTTPTASKKRKQPTTDAHNDNDDDDISSSDDEKFEEVPMDDSDDYSDDSEARAEVLAMGQLLLKKKSRESLIDNGYNRYAFHDHDTLPEWFHHDESMHNRPQMPITKDEVIRLKQYIKDINERPIKKVQEARGRKKMKFAQRLEKTRALANAVAENDSLGASEKMKSIEKLYNKAGDKGTKRKQKTLVVSRAHKTRAFNGKAVRPVGVRGKFKMVDRRMKNDKRAEKRAELRKAKSRKNKNKKKAAAVKRRKT